MRLPSLQSLSEQTVAVVKRFPVEIFVSLAGTVIALLLSRKFQSDATQWQLGKCLLVCLLALPSTLAITISVRFRNLPQKWRWILYGMLVVMLTIFYCSLSAQKEHPKDFIRFAMLFVAAHLLVACAGFIRRGSTLGFWQYNRILFLRILTAGIFSAVLFLGLIGALAALNELFDLHIQENWFGRIFIVIVGVFNTLFFLHGVPDDSAALEAETEYPKILSIFTRFVLLPLVFIYFAILLAYEVKIVTNWQLPNGWVSNLIIAFAIVGILSILLVYPIRQTAENTWVKIFAKWFYLLLIPLIVLMFVAIGKRISDYGFTEERLLVLATATWLSIIAIYFLARPNGDIRIIPLSLAIVTLLLQFSMFQISETSQRERLIGLLNKNGLLQNGRAQILQKGKTIPEKDLESIRSIFQYMANMHGAKSLQPIVAHNKSDNQANGYFVSEKYLDSLGYKTSVQVTEQTKGPIKANDEPIEVTGYRLLVPIRSYFDQAYQGWQAWNDGGSLLIRENSNAPIESFSPQPISDRLYILGQPTLSLNLVSPQKLMQDTTLHGKPIRIVYTSLDLVQKEGQMVVTHFAGYVLVK